MSRTLKDRPWRIKGTEWRPWFDEPTPPKAPRHSSKMNPSRVHFSNPYGPTWYRRETIYRRERPEFRNWVASLSGNLADVDPPPLRYREYWD